MKITGLDKVLRNLEFNDTKLRGAIRECGEIVEQSAIANIVEPILKPMVNKYDVIDRDFIGVNIGTDSEIGAYEEFGTGGFVVIPPETTPQYVMQWYVNGKGTLHPNPWLFPAWRNNKSRVFEIIKKATVL